MKKYLGLSAVLFSLLIVTLALNAPVALGEENGKTSTVETRPAQRQEQEKMRLKTQEDLEIKRQEAHIQILKLQAEKAKVQVDLKMKRETMQAELKDAKEETKTQIQETQRELKTEMAEKRAELRTEIQNKREEIQTKIKATREMAKNKMESLKEEIKGEQDIVKAKIKETRIIGRENALNKFDAVVKRVEDLKDRINTEINRLEVKEVNVTEAESFVVVAEAKLNEAKTKIIETNALLATSIKELTSADRIKLGTLLKDIQGLIRESHQALNNALRYLKEAVQKQIEEQTPVATTTTTDQ